MGFLEEFPNDFGWVPDLGNHLNSYTTKALSKEYASLGLFPTEGTVPNVLSYLYIEKTFELKNEESG